MKLEILKELSLKRPPTDICSQFGNLYVSTKGKRLFLYNTDDNTQKSILFSSQVNTLSSSDSLLFCGCNDGKIFGLLNNNKVGYRSSCDSAMAYKCIYCPIKKELYVSTVNKKVVVLNDDGILKRSHFCHETPVVDFDISFDRVIACLSENNKSVMIFDPFESKPKNLRIQHGFPEVVKYQNDLLLIGTNKGEIQVYSNKTLKKQFSIILGSSPQSIFVVNDNMVLAGLTNEKIALVEIIIKESPQILFQLDVCGIPIGFCKHKDHIAVTVSREPRLGRWGKLKKGHNKVIFLKIVE